MRDWSTIARLIRTKVETKKWDTRRVQMYLGHDKQRTTDSYIEFAEEYYRQEPKDWFSHALKLYNNGYKGGKCEKIKRTAFSGLLTEIPPRNDYGLGGI